MSAATTSCAELIMYCLPRDDIIIAHARVTCFWVPKIHLTQCVSRRDLSLVIMLSAQVGYRLRIKASVLLIFRAGVRLWRVHSIRGRPRNDGYISVIEEDESTLSAC